MNLGIPGAKFYGMNRISPNSYVEAIIPNVMYSEMEFWEDD